MKSFAYQHEVQEARIAALLEMGYLVVREIGVMLGTSRRWHASGFTLPTPLAFLPWPTR